MLYCCHRMVKYDTPDVVSPSNGFVQAGGLGIGASQRIQDIFYIGSTGKDSFVYSLQQQHQILSSLANDSKPYNLHYTL